MGNVLETAMSRTEAGSRPADRAAASMRARTPASRSEMLLSLLLDHRLKRGERRLDLRRLRAVRVDLQVGLERADRQREVAEVERRHAELVVRHRHVRVGLGGGFELCLGFGKLLRIEQDDALVVDRLGAAAAAGAASGPAGKLGGVG